MNKTYWILVGRESNGPFECIFGDYDKAVVQEEKEDYMDGYNNYSRLRVVKTGDTQAEIDATIDALNG